MLKSPGCMCGWRPTLRQSPVRMLLTHASGHAAFVNQKALDAGRLTTKGTIDHEALKDAGLARGGRDGVRLLGKGRKQRLVSEARAASRRAANAFAARSQAVRRDSMRRDSRPARRRARARTPRKQAKGPLHPGDFPDGARAHQMNA